MATTSVHIIKSCPSQIMDRRICSVNYKYHIFETETIHELPLFVDGPEQNFNGSQLPHNR